MSHCKYLRWILCFEMCFIIFFFLRICDSCCLLFNLHIHNYSNLQSREKKIWIFGCVFEFYSMSSLLLTHTSTIFLYSFVLICWHVRFIQLHFWFTWKLNNVMKRVFLLVCSRLSFVFDFIQIAISHNFAMKFHNYFIEDKSLPFFDRFQQMH